MTDASYPGAPGLRAAQASGDAGASPMAVVARTYVDWSAIAAGAVLAVAISLAMLGLSAALGLSIVSFEPGESAGGIVMVVAASLWLAWAHVSGLLAGGYLAGRMRVRVDDATSHEAGVRDLAHGVLVWAAAMVLSAALITGGAGAALNAAAGGAPVAATAASGADEETARYIADRALRADATEETAPPDARRRDIVAGIVMRAMAQGDLPALDRAWLTTTVAAQNDLTPEAAQERVAEVERWLAQSVAAVAAGAERARVNTALLAFFTTATLLVGGAAAALAASYGGRHRDEGLVVSFLDHR